MSPISAGDELGPAPADDAPVADRVDWLREAIAFHNLVTRPTVLWCWPRAPSMAVRWRQVPQQAGTAGDRLLLPQRGGPTLLGYALGTLQAA